MNTPIRHLPLKRIFDLSFSFVVILLGIPVFLLISLMIRITSPGPIFYRQKRIGRGGKPFACIKFRTMYQDADQRLTDLLSKYPDLAKEWRKKRKLTDDPRVTPFGQFLRQTSLDELPQFWNVIKGDLSVVGPRPVVDEELREHFGSKASKILSVRPGLTGLWQVSGRNDLSYSERIDLDESYVDNRSFLLDLKMIAKTIPLIFSGKGAY